MGLDTVVLEGAPNALIGSTRDKSNTVQAMHLELSSDVLDELLQCIRNGKTPQVLFGKTALLKYDGTSHELHAKPERFRNELYCEKSLDNKNTWEFSGLITQRLALQDAEIAAAGTDRALEALKNTMASIEQEREARKVVIATPEARPTKGSTKPQAKATRLKPNASPLPGSLTPSQSSRPPTSTCVDMPYDTAIRRALVHFLAIQPRSYTTCRSALRTDPRVLLEKTARLTGKAAEEWALKDQAYKELDVYKFNYSAKDRETAVDNAIRAYDRMRLSKDDPIWQKLLPEDERGMGKTLSRLHMKDPVKTTPAVKPQAFDKKTGMPKRKEVKKPEKEVPATKKKEAGDDGKSAALKSAAESRPTQAEPRKVKQPVKRTAVKGEETRTPVQKATKPSTAAKSLLNKPKNGSPLGASPPVNASDFEDGHFKRLSAATSPRSSTKRKAEQPVSSGPSKRPHIDSASGSSSEERPLKARAATAASHNSTTNSNKGLANGHRANGNISPDSESSSARSPDITLSWRQSVEMARKFTIYYQRYKKLYLELSQGEAPPTERQREELLEMHRRLERMKRQVNNGAL